jgi:hypothetical protein
MAYLDPSSTFQSWILTPQELQIGHILSDLQTKAIQNYICQLANERINLVFTEANKQRDAELQGAIGTLRYLLDISAEKQKELIEEANLNNPQN